MFKREGIVAVLSVVAPRAARQDQARRASAFASGAAEAAAYRTPRTAIERTQRVECEARRRTRCLHRCAPNRAAAKGALLRPGRRGHLEGADHASMTRRAGCRSLEEISSNEFSGARCRRVRSGTKESGLATPQRARCSREVFVTRRLGLPEIAPLSAISGMTALKAAKKQHGNDLRQIWHMRPVAV